MKSVQLVSIILPVPVAQRIRFQDQLAESLSDGYVIEREYIVPGTPLGAVVLILVKTEADTGESVDDDLYPFGDAFMEVWNQGMADLCDYLVEIIGLITKGDDDE